MLKPGNYVAKPVGGCFDETTTKGTPYVKIYFKTKDTNETISGNLYLTEKAEERTWDTMVGVLGFDAHRELLANPAGDNYFDETFFTTEEVEIIVVSSQDPKYTEVKYINKLGGTNKVGMPVQKVMSGLNIKAKAAAARARLGLGYTPKPETKTPEDFGF